MKQWVHVFSLLAKFAGGMCLFCTGLGIVLNEPRTGIPLIVIGATAALMTALKVALICPQE